MKFNFKLLKKSGDNEDSSAKKSRFNLNNIKKINPWGVGALVTFIVSLFLLAYFGYLKRQAKRLDGVIKEKEEIIVTKNRAFNKLTKQESYQRYQATKTLVEQSKGKDWKESITYLINLYDVLQSLDDNESDVVLEDFTVNVGTVNFKGTVTDIRDIYEQGGLLDQLVALEFIERINIPFYKKEEEGYSFTLTANIKKHDGVEGPL